ncbi:MAG TPA: hypothetical protein VIU12_30705 [Chryseolinea sp.]
MKKLIVVIAAAALVLMTTSMALITSRVPEEGPVKWLTLEEAIKKAATEKRPNFYRRLHRLVWLVQGDGPGNL